MQSTSTTSAGATNMNMNKDNMHLKAHNCTRCGAQDCRCNGGCCGQEHQCNDVCQSSGCTKTASTMAGTACCGPSAGQTATTTMGNNNMGMRQAS